MADDNTLTPEVFVAHLASIEPPPQYGKAGSVRAIFAHDAAQRERIAALEAENEKLRATLSEISRGEGAFSRDPLEHASNCIEDMKRLALAALLLLALTELGDIGSTDESTCECAVPPPYSPGATCSNCGKRIKEKG